MKVLKLKTIIAVIGIIASTAFAQETAENQNIDLSTSTVSSSPSVSSSASNSTQHAKYKKMNKVGKVLLITGGACIVGGTIAMIAGTASTVNNAADGDLDGTTKSAGTVVVGGLLFGIGIPVTLAGIPVTVVGGVKARQYAAGGGYQSGIQFTMDF